MEKEYRKLLKWFDGYTATFKSDDPKIQINYDLKILHTKRVLKNVEKLCEVLHLTEEETLIARSSALLHDIGRFEQFQRYNTFVDKQSIDHALLGLEIIERENPLNGFPEQVVTEIKAAIQFHNKLEVPTKIDEKSQFFTRLLRDADKLDIYRVVTEYYEKQKAGHHNEAIVLGLPDEKKYSPHVIDDIHHRRIVKSQELQTINDFKLLQMAWIFDINFVATLKNIKDNKFLELIYESLPKDEKIKKAYEILNHFLSENCKKSPKAILF